MAGLNLVARLTLKDDFTSRMRKATSSLGDVEKRTRSATSGFKNLTSSMAGMAGAIGLTAALSKGIGMIKNSISSAFDRIDTMERFESTMSLLLGTSKAAKSALDDINEAVTGTAFGLDLGAKSVQAFVSRGIEVKKATGWFEAMGDAVTFWGSGTNEELESVMGAMGKMVSSGKVNMMQMNTLFAAGIDAPGIFARATGRSVVDVKKALSSGKLSVESFFDTVVKSMNEGTNGTQKVAGAAKESGNTWANAIGNMQFAVVRGVTSIIQSLDEMLAHNGLPSMREMIGKFGKTYEKVLKNAASKIQPFINAMKSMYRVIKPIVPVIKSFAIAVGIAIAAIGGFFAIVAGLKAVAAGILFLFSPIGLVIGAIAGLTLGFQAAYKQSEPFRLAVDKIIGGIKGLFAALGGNGAKSMDIMQKAGLSSDQIRGVFAFSDTLKGAFDKLMEIFTGFGTLISGGGSADLLASMGISQEAFNEFKAILPVIKEGLIAAGVAIGTFRAAVVGLTIISSVVSFIKAWRAATVGMTAAQVAMNIAMSLNPIGLVAAAIAGIIAVGVLLWRNWDTVKEKTVALWDSIGGLGGAIGIILGPLGFLINAAIDLAKNWDSTKSVWENVWGAIQRSAATSINAVIGLINEMISVINMIPGVNIPIVAKVDWGAATPTGGDFRKHESASMSKGASKYHGIDYVAKNNTPMDLHRGEAVLTASENKARQQGGSGSGIVINMNGVTVRENADIDRIADQLYRKLFAAEQGGGY